MTTMIQIGRGNNMSAKKIPGPPVGYTDLLDHAIVEGQKENKDKKYYPLRPSAAGFCALKLAQDLMTYYGYAEYTRESISPGLTRLFKLGHSIEYSTLQYFNNVPLFDVKYKQQLVTCFRLVDGTLIEGSCDACFISDKWKAVMDVKSTKDKFSRAFSTQWVERFDKFDGMNSLSKLSDTAWYADDVIEFMKEYGDDYLFDNIYQLNLYASTDFMKERSIDHCVIYKYNKNDSRHYELRFKPTDILAKEVEDKFNAIVTAVKKKDISSIKPTCKLGTMRGAFCGCNGHPGDVKKAWYATLPKKKWPVDIAKLNSAELEIYFKSYEDRLKGETHQKNIELNILERLQAKKVQKIKLDNGHIYEVKFLKSPKPHYELRRSKL